MKLLVGTESTWSLRAIICGYLSGVDFELEIIDLAAPGYKDLALKTSPTGLVPALVTDNVVIHDSLAIAEYFNEISDGSLYPRESKARAQSRSLCAELHAGFRHFRERCPFSINEVEPLKYLDPLLSHELLRIETIFSDAKLPYMYADTSVVDAFYAVLAYRLKTYGVHLSGVAGEYQQALIEWPVLSRAIRELHA